MYIFFLDTWWKCSINFNNSRISEQRESTRLCSVSLSIKINYINNILICHKGDIILLNIEKVSKYKII